MAGNVAYRERRSQIIDIFKFQLVSTGEWNSILQNFPGHSYTLPSYNFDFQGNFVTLRLVSLLEVLDFFAEWNIYIYR